MRTSRTWVAVLAVVVVAVVVVGAVGLALGGRDGSSTSRQDFEARIVNTRDRVDFALGRLSKAQSLEELLNRMDEAAEMIDDTAGDLDDLDAPDQFADAHGRLVEQLEQLAVDVQGTADQARVPGFEDILMGVSGLDFPSWDSINEVLGELAEMGIEVQPLSRHTT